MSKVIALIGNPNSGKTTLFNNLTGAHQKVGNWTGVTIEKKTGHIDLVGEQGKLVDLPGIYSLEQEYQGLDEQIARTFLENEDVDLIINIVDTSNLERNLVLTEQLRELKIPMIVVLNMQDVAEQHGIKVDVEELESRLAIPVVSTTASLKKGMNHLKLHLLQQVDPEHQQLVHVPDEKPTEEDASEKILHRYRQVKKLTEGVISSKERVPATEKVDRWILNRWLGIPIFLALMYLLFTIAINVGAVFIDFFDIFFNALLVDSTRWLLEQIHTPELIITLLADGVGGGVTLVFTFIPVIAFLYFGLSLLEDSGYISRAAFVVDRLMAKLGLPGNAFVPLIVGFGCNVPSVMATRSLGRESDRLMTIAMAPFMSCGARLTVYALFAAAFFPEQGQNIVFVLYLLGIIMAVLTGYIFRKQLFPKEITPSFQEMPAYHKPLLRNILFMTWFRLRSFILKAGQAIVIVVMVLSLLNSIGTDGSFGNEDSKDSILSVVGKTITPAFAPIGIAENNWPATVGLFTGMFAKEAVVGTLNSLYAETSKDDGSAPDLVAAAGEALTSIVDAAIELTSNLGDPLGINIGDVSDKVAVAEDHDVKLETLVNMTALFGTPLAAFTYLIFILLYAPCVAVVGAIVREAGWQWACLVFGWSTALAYFTASTIYQLGTFSVHPTYSGITILSTSVVMALFIFNLKRLAGASINKNIIPIVEI
ncbi:MAG: ferrous iron transport protein B [Gammaproteobacteria bacterium]|nr:ferrous iron transport protein B [Gammaproteobacteria bacterium]